MATADMDVVGEFMAPMLVLENWLWGPFEAACAVTHRNLTVASEHPARSGNGIFPNL